MASILIKRGLESCVLSLAVAAVLAFVFFSPMPGNANPFFFGQQAAAGETTGGGTTGTTGATASDNFDSYSNGSNLQDQTGWSALNGSILIEKPSSDGRIRSNGGGINSVVRITTPTFAADHEAEMTLDPGISASGAIGVAVRCQSGAFTCYEVHWDDSANAIYLAYISAGSWNQISTTTKNYVTGNKLRLEASGTGSATRLTVKEDTGSGWVTVFSSVDPGTYIDGGQPGVYGYGNSGNFLQGDNWAAADL